MSSQAGGSGLRGKGKGKGRDADTRKGKRKHREEEEAVENLRQEDATFCSSCGSSDAWAWIQCNMCEAWYHGWCVNLRIAQDDDTWFNEYACPDCVKKGKRSTRSKRSDRITRERDEYSNLYGSEEALWSLVTRTSETSMRYKKSVCETAMKNVEDSVVGWLEGEHPHVELLELIVGYLHHIMIPTDEEQLLALFDFHKKLVVRFLEASSSHMRRWGWNQLDSLVALTHGHRWSPRAIRVEGAGSTDVDGIYRVSPNEERPPREDYCVSGGTPPLSMATYTHEGGGCLLSLMPTAEEKNIWYITSAPDQTGQETPMKEYYSFQAPTPAENLLRPCGLDWEKAVDGADPPPFVSLVTTEGYVWPDGEEIETLERKLTTWMIENQVVSKLFKEPSWLMVVNGSSELQRFIVKMGGLLNPDNPDHISLIWRSSVKGRPGLQIAAQELLMRLALDGKTRLVVQLFRTLQEGVGGNSERGRLKDILEFLTQLVHYPGHRILRRFEDTQVATANLVWSLLKKPDVLQSESCQFVSTLLTSVAYASTETTMDAQNHLQRFIARCISSWKYSSELSESVSTVRLVLDTFKPKQIRQLARLFHAGDADVNVNLGRSIVGVGDVGPFSKEEAPKCVFCDSPNFLENDGNDMFGVVSWRCTCKPVPKAHLRCTLSYVDINGARRTPCPVCKADITFGKDRTSVSRAVRLNVHNPPEGDAPVPADDNDDALPDDDQAKDPDYESGEEHTQL